MSVSDEPARPADDETPASDASPTETAGDTPPASGPPRLRGRRRRFVWRLGKRASALLVAALAAALVSVLAIDLGPSLRGVAEREGSKRLQRPLHIGTLSVRLLRGEFVVDKLRIEGLTPADAPFFTAERITVGMPWWSIVTGELLIRDVTMRDWTMTIETFANNRHNFPKISTPKSTGPRRFVTTLQQFTGTRGRVRYIDHVTPWSVDANHLELSIAKSDKYRGTATFRDGVIAIQRFVPMAAGMQCTFVIDGGRVVLPRIDLQADGSRSRVRGDVNISRWPEQTYEIEESTVDFARMKDLFFEGRDFTLGGDGHFTGTFRLARNFRELKGRFRSPHATLNVFGFDDLRGSLIWTRDRFEVTESRMAFAGGQLALTYGYAPLGAPTPPHQTLDARYTQVDTEAVSRLVGLEGMSVAGRADGRHTLDFPSGRFDLRTGTGEMVIAAPDGQRMQGRELIDLPGATGRIAPLDREAPLGRVPIVAELHYAYQGARFDVARSYVATPETYVEFNGRTQGGDVSDFAFHVTSRDWQESDKLLVGIMTAVGARTRPVAVGGVGTFDGRMTGRFKAPRIEGEFAGRQLRGWDVTWGTARTALVIENNYVDIADAEIEQGDARLRVSGRFSLGFPRRDGGEEMRARVQLFDWPMRDLRHAFALDDYPVEGPVSGDFQLQGPYRGLFGFGRLQLGQAVAYDEPLERATAALRFDGLGVHLDDIVITKGGGRVDGDAYVAWAGTYRFKVEGRGIPVTTVRALTWEGIPLTGTLRMTAQGDATFKAPRYDVQAAIDDLYLGEEGIGQLTAQLSIRERQMYIDALEMASSRLAVSGTGRMPFDDDADAEITLTFANTSLDPYLRVFSPTFSPFTTMVGSGQMRLVGPFNDTAKLKGDLRVDSLRLQLIDYQLRNDGPLRLALGQDRLLIDRMGLIGDGTRLDVVGEVQMDTERMSIRLLGDANLGLLQGALQDVRASGAAEVSAEISGPWRSPVVGGSALITEGRLRYGGLPHSLEAINGTVRFDTGGASLEGVTARLGGGPVRFGGRVAFAGVSPSEFNVTATGYEMRIRYPEGFRSIVDADLALRGPVAQPTLSGTVQVRDAVLTRTIDTSGTGVFGLAASTLPAPSMGTVASYPLRFDLRVSAPSTLRIANNTTRLVSSAELTLRGTYDRPQLFGRAEIERGEVFFEGKRYNVRRGVVD
ncbi:MAG TPA: translocation/assembly module TamB domain-containing protein, partial [Luteitalea sp.]|nr:translocation/assembly module TamB domain-containing protein [Luteitalea sp.]